MGDIKNYGIKREKKKVHKYVFIGTIIMALIYVITSLIIYWYVHHSTKLGLKLNTKLSEHLQKMKEMKMPEWLKAYDNCKELQQSMMRMIMFLFFLWKMVILTLMTVALR